VVCAQLDDQKRVRESSFSSVTVAVDQLVGQLAKDEGLHIIDSVGSDRKPDYITTELGFNEGSRY
jgi:NADPH-dependent curcumin reductase CurA